MIPKHLFHYTCALWFSVGCAFAQTDGPTTQNMIEQLKPKPARLTRSLTVERAAEQVPSATPDSVHQALPAAPTQSKPTAEPKPQLSLNILFDLNSARIKPDSQVSLSRLADALQSPALMHSRFLIEGHTDAKGNPDSNLKLSRLRAESVALYLSSLGVDKKRLKMDGKGSTELANPMAPYAYENRRVKIINLD